MTHPSSDLQLVPAMSWMLSLVSNLLNRFGAAFHSLLFFFFCFSVFLCSVVSRKNCCQVGSLYWDAALPYVGKKINPDDKLLIVELRL